MSCVDEERPPPADLVLVSHGRADHMGDLVSAARDGGAIVVAVFDLCEWLRRKGTANVSPMNKGGSQLVAGLQ